MQSNQVMLGSKCKNSKLLYRQMYAAGSSTGIQPGRPDVVHAEELGRSEMNEIVCYKSLSAMAMW